MRRPNKLIKSFKGKEGTVRVYENGFLESFINEGAVIETAFLRDGKTLLESTGIEKYYVLSESGGFYHVSKTARELSASYDFSNCIGALAVVINNIAVKLVFELYLKIDKPSFPVKSFTNRVDAVEWLNDIIDAREIHAHDRSA